MSEFSDPVDAADKIIAGVIDSAVSAAMDAAKNIPVGRPGECISCGEYSGRLVKGNCVDCRQFYGLG